MLFRHYQQYPYVGNEVHSGLISLGLDVGIVGVLVFCLLFFRYLKPLLLLKSPVLPALVVLVGHSFFDVDMTFGFYWYLVLGLIGVELARLHVARQERAISVVRQFWHRHGMAAVTLTVLIGCLVCTVNFEMGNLSFANVTRATSEQDATRALQQAIKWNPYSIPYRLEMAHHLEKAHEDIQALPLLQTGVSFEPHNAMLLWEIGNVYWAMNQPVPMMSYMEAAIQEDRYDTAKQEDFVHRLQQMAKQEYLQGHRQEATQLAKQVDVAFTKYVSLDAQLKEMPYRVNDRKFAVTAKAKLDAAQAYVLLGQYADAKRLLQALSEGKSGQMQENTDFDLRLVQVIEERVQQGTLPNEDAYEEYLALQ
jgi:tetratricopeptide (TPR) repeat protein